MDPLSGQTLVGALSLVPSPTPCTQIEPGAEQVEKALGDALVDVEIGAQRRVEPLDGTRCTMALVQHRLDGIEQRCALGAEPVLQCPVGGEQMTRQRTMARAGRALAQLPDQVPADASQAHRRHRPPLAQCIEPRQHALLCQHQPRRAVAKILRKLRALPRPELTDSPRRLRNQRLDLLGAVQLAAGNIDAFERPAQRVHRRLEGVESFDGLGALASRLAQRTFGLAPARLVSRAYSAQPPQRLALALNRRVGAPLQLAPHLVHLVEHMKAVVALLGIGQDLSNPRRYPPCRILDHHRQRQPLPPDPRAAPAPTPPHRAWHSTTTRTDTPSPGPPPPAPARLG